MENNGRKSRIKHIKIADVINYDYSWIFFNGIETVKTGVEFKHKLKQMFINSTSSCLVLKSGSKGF